MADLVYGVSGEGSGHSSRAREILRHLAARGHRTQVVTYDRGYRNLRDEFDVFETEGLHIATADNRVDLVRTFTHNLRRLPEGLGRFRELKTLFDELRPDGVITDFEPMTAYLAGHLGLPLISIDNQHRMRYMDYPRPPGSAAGARLTETVIRGMVPRPDVSLITTFYFGEVRNDHTFLFPPILGREVRELEPTDGDHVLVYFTKEFGSFVEVLAGCGDRCFIVYGMEHEPDRENLTFRKPDREGFLADLAAARAVVATAGFTLITESLYLGKPYLALPMRGQFEQELNAYLLERLGYGKDGAGAEPAAALREFLERLPDYREALWSYRREDNTALEKRLDRLLADGCAEARSFRERRGKKFL